jgi:hypothetical protein
MRRVRKNINTQSARALHGIETIFPRFPNKPILNNMINQGSIQNQSGRLRCKSLVDDTHVPRFGGGVDKTLN